MPKYYKFMLGEESKYAAECYEGEFISMWYEINEDFTDYLKDKENLEKKYIPILMEGYSKYDKDGNEREERYKEQSAKLITPQIWTFCKEMQIGDIVICPTGKKFNSYHVGKVKSDYYFKRDYFKNGEIQPHKRDIEWFSEKLYINDMSDELIELLKKSHGTVNDLNQCANKIKDDLKKLLKIVIPSDQDTNTKNILTEENKEMNNIKVRIYTEYLINYLFQNIIGLLVQYLNKILPSITSNWWEKLVKEKLKPYQLKKIERNSINNTLNEFDLAELLLIIDNNWYDISQECNFMYEDRNIVKEMISVRNRVSHLSSKGYNSLFDLFRDFDTVKRFLLIIDVRQENIQKVIEEIKNILLNIMQDILSSCNK